MKSKVKSRLLYGRHHIMADTGEQCECCGRAMQTPMHVGRPRRVVPAVRWAGGNRRSVMGIQIDRMIDL